MNNLVVFLVNNNFWFIIFVLDSSLYYDYNSYIHWNHPKIHNTPSTSLLTMSLSMFISFLILYPNFMSTLSSLLIFQHKLLNLFIPYNLSLHCLNKSPIFLLAMRRESLKWSWEISKITNSTQRTSLSLPNKSKKKKSAMN